MYLSKKGKKMQCKRKKGKPRKYAKGGKLKDACWSGYKAVGFKKKNGKRVPNCVPK